MNEHFARALQRQHLAPLWHVLHSLVPPAPRSSYAPFGWRYDEVRPHLLRAGELITAREAERRVLILENPAQPGQASITPSLYAGLQLLLPGEVAPSHRHTQSALRLVLEGAGAYTAVDGERTQMEGGDFIITPSMTWHDHGNAGSEPVIWLDGLDIPLVRLLECGFAEKHPQESQPVSRPSDATIAQFGSNLAPLDHTTPTNGASPLFNYRFARTRAALQSMQHSFDSDLWHGHAMRFLHPLTGASPIPTIGAYVQLLPADFRGNPYRSTAGRVFCCLEGHGRIDAEGWSFEFGPRDVWVVPGWLTHRFSADAGAIVFSFSDRPVQGALGLWREEKLT